MILFSRYISRNVMKITGIYWFLILILNVVNLALEITLIIKLN